jgi:hypothetical protein
LRCNFASGAVGLGAGDLRCLLVQFRHPVSRLVKLQTVPGAAEGVGQDDVGSCFHECTLQLRDPIGMIGVPKFGCVTRLQAAFEQVAAGRAVGEQPGPLC